MEVSKLTLSEEMRKQMQQPRITQQRKKELKTNLVKEYIKNKGENTPITKLTLGLSAGYRENQKASAYLFIEDLINKGIITKINIGKRKFIWSIVDNSKVSTATTPVVTKDKKVEVAQELESKIDKKSIDILVKDFYWETDSDSLHEFLAWIK